MFEKLLSKQPAAGEKSDAGPARLGPRTRIADLSAVGAELSEEHLRLVTGGSGPVLCTAVRGNQCDPVPN